MKIKWFLFSFKGRLNRQPFWLYTLCAGLLWLILSLLLGIDITKRGNPKSIIPMLILLWPSLAVQAKRWHDRGKSAWWILINIIPIAGPIWAFVENGCLSGRAGENRFGKDPLGRVSEEPIVLNESITAESKPSLNVTPASEWKPQKYYLSTLMKAVTIFACIMAILTSLIMLKISFLTSVETPGGVFPYAIFDTAVIAMLIWRMMTPVVDISESGIKVGIPFVFKTNTAKWDEIDAMVIGETGTFGIKDKNIKLLLKSEKGSSKEMMVSLKSVEKPAEIIERLRARIPEKGYEDIKQAPALQKPMTKSEIRYRGWILNEAGLTRGKEAISWINIRELKYAGLVIAGYGTTTITYVGGGGLKKSATVQPATKEEYLDFIRYLIQHSPKASIDPGLLKALEYSPKDARADLSSIVLFLTGMILIIITSTLIFWYSNGINTGYLNAALLIPFGIVPLFMALKVITGRFRGKTEPSAQKILWPLVANVGPAISVPIFFIMSPFSLYWLAGDLSVKTGDIGKAEGYYQTALEKLPDSIDVLYEMGKINRDKKNYEKAFDYLKRAYIKDPSYWGPKAVELIPDTLMKLGRYDEALKWCDQISGDRPNKIDITRAISKKKDEIISEKDSKKQIIQQP
ncbi:MAG: DUF805 domain-containing protein [Thermodesulfovibrionales bacterium]